MQRRPILLCFCTIAKHTSSAVKQTKWCLAELSSSVGLWICWPKYCVYSKTRDFLIYLSCHNYNFINTVLLQLKCDINWCKYWLNVCRVYLTTRYFSVDVSVSFISFFIYWRVDISYNLISQDINTLFALAIFQCTFFWLTCFRNILLKPTIQKREYIFNYTIIIITHYI